MLRDGLLGCRERYRVDITCLRSLVSTQHSVPRLSACLVDLRPPARVLRHRFSTAVSRESQRCRCAVQHARSV